MLGHRDQPIRSVQVNRTGVTCGMIWNVTPSWLENLFLSSSRNLRVSISPAILKLKDIRKPFRLLWRLIESTSSLDTFYEEPGLSWSTNGKKEHTFVKKFPRLYPLVLLIRVDVVKALGWQRAEIWNRERNFYFLINVWWNYNIER
jgi:hypothetical protein